MPASLWYRYNCVLLSFQVKDDTAAITESTMDSSDIKIHLDVDGLSSNGGLHTMKVHRSAWLKYYVQIPPETISQVKVCQSKYCRH